MNADSGRTSVLHTWWPLAASWLLMGVELPAISAAVGRLDDPEVMLAAFGGVVFPIALLIEAPVIMMLAASTTLSRDLVSFKRLERFMIQLSLLLTCMHAALVFITPLFDLVVGRLMDVPESVRGPAWVGLACMLPWTWAIADRRFRQGALIRFGQRAAVAQGTTLRLCVTLSAVGLLVVLDASGIVVAAVALSCGVVFEACFVAMRTRRLLGQPLSEAPQPTRARSTGELLSFYVPLMLTPLLILAAQPTVAAGISRLPDSLACLAVWAPAGGVVFLLRSTGLAFNEVVISHSDHPDSARALWRFGLCWGLILSAVLAVLALTPLVEIWFRDVIGLNEDLTALGASTLWLATPIPLLTFLQSYWQGRLVHQHRTRAVTESVGAYLVVTVAGMVGGVALGTFNGLEVGFVVFVAANVAQAAWLWWRCARGGPAQCDGPEPTRKVPEPY